jgi:hypothetical protein
MDANGGSQPALGLIASVTWSGCGRGRGRLAFCLCEGSPSWPHWSLCLRSCRVRPPRGNQRAPSSCGCSRRALPAARERFETEHSFRPPTRTSAPTSSAGAPQQAPARIAGPERGFFGARPLLDKADHTFSQCLSNPTQEVSFGLSSASAAPVRGRSVDAVPCFCRLTRRLKSS